jgi:hypothetical protein
VAHHREGELFEAGASVGLVFDARRATVLR